MNDFASQVTLFFAQLTPAEQAIMGIALLLVFIFGLLLGWLLQKRATRRFRQQAILMRTERDVAGQQAAKLKLDNATLARELDVTSSEKVAALDQVLELQRQLQAEREAAAPIRSNMEALTTTNQTYAATIESLNDQVIGLKTRNESLLNNLGEAAGAGNGGMGYVGSDDDWTQPDSSGAMNASDNDRVVQLEERLASLEHHLASFAEQRELAGRIAQQQQRSPNVTATEHTVIVPDFETDADGEPLVIRADTTNAGVRMDEAGRADVVVTAVPSLQTPNIEEVEPGRDDLTAIKNIGPFLQEQLNKVDVFRYEQIAQWNRADIVTYTELIGYLPGVIERDDWVGQARTLAAANNGDGDTTDEAEASPTTYVVNDFTPELPDDREATSEDMATYPGRTDLQVVEGIGPRIAALLSSHGIYDLAQLAASDTDSLQEILDTAGGSFRFHDPSTWVMQAALATDGKYEELSRWQDQLTGGRR